MPYINNDERAKFSDVLDNLPEIVSKGELEFIIFYCMLKYMYNKDYNYSNLHNAVYGAIHCGDEFRRRFLDDREIFAMSKNGDIIPKCHEDIGV